MQVRIPGSGRFPGGGHDNQLHSCLENPMDRGAWRAIVHRVTKSRTQLSTHALVNACRLLLLVEIYFKRKKERKSVVFIE